MAERLTTISVYLDQRQHGVLHCVFCGAKQSITLAAHQVHPGGKSFHVRCGACHHIFGVLIEYRHHQRLQVALPGTLYAPHVPEALDTITVTSLSAGGISFRTTQHGVALGARYTVVFVLQDEDQSVIIEEIIIRRVEGTAVGAEFAALATVHQLPDVLMVPGFAALSQE
jgi:PilZ domain-containing protein